MFVAMPSLPTDTILYEILPRLAAKALMRFKLVSKSFNKHISSPEFVEDQLRRSNSKGILVFIDQQSWGGVHLVDLDSPGSPPVFCSFPNPVAVVGTCNGLVCFLVDLTVYHEFYLFNPSTGISLHIPPCPLERWGPEEDDCLFMIMNFGFGYDCRTDDYKIVGIMDSGLGDDSGVSRDFMVYSLRAKSWKLIQNGLPLFEDYVNSEGGVCIDHHLVHWLFYTVARIARIACFNLCSERWEEDVPLPDVNLPDLIPGRLTFALGHFDGLLCLLASADHGRVEVWVMKEHRIKESWVKLSKIDHLQISLGSSLFSCRRDSDLEIELHRDDNWGSYGFGRDKEGKLIWYWIQDDKSRPAEIHQVHVIGAHVCKGSLVTIPNGIELGNAKLK